MMTRSFQRTRLLKPSFLLCFSFLFCLTCFAQEKPTYQQRAKAADSLYNKKNYPAAVTAYLSLLEVTDFSKKKTDLYYNIACCMNLQGKTDSAIVFLKKAIANGYSNKQHMLTDADLNSLHNTDDWKQIISTMPENKKALNDDPAKARFITEDVHRFWKAYDMAMSDSLHFKEIFRQQYFDKATVGMNDYMGLKVSSIDLFIEHIRSAPQFYKAIRSKTLLVDEYKKDFLSAFKKLKSLYPPAQFPDVYFVIGAFSSAGTVSDAGLLIGVNQICEANDVPVQELSFRLRTRMSKFKSLPNIIAHESIHYQQDGMKEDTTTLCYVIREGMADFIGELISGNTANSTLFEWAKGKEKAIWEKFRKDMYFDRYFNWIANSQQATPDNLPDQGYWIGYQICKAYYENTADKKAAIKEMLNIQDYKAFLDKSKWEEKLEQLIIKN
jgi:hypothetical protein